jgi:N-acyl-D-amino-acid deacylase
VPVFALAAAREKGFAIDEKILQEQYEFTLNTFKPILKEVATGKGLGGGNTMANYGLHTLLTAGKPDAEVIEAITQFLLVRQKEDGSWPPVTQRPPTEGSKFTNSYFALKFLKDQKGEAEKKFAKGKTWLLENDPISTEDRVFHLQALKVIDAEKALLQKAQQAILSRQKADGSFSQLDDMKGDAYATGTALFALLETGVKRDDPAIQKAVVYLLKTQDEKTGAWLVETRSRPIQTFFDNGDPGGKSQFITIAATGWSVRALLEMVEKR